MAIAIKGKLENLRQLQKTKAREDTRLAKVQAAEKASRTRTAGPTGKAAEISAEDLKLFRKTVSSVTPLPDTGRRIHSAIDRYNSEYFQAKRQQAEGAAAPAPHKEVADARARKATPGKGAAARRHDLPEGTYIQHKDSGDLIKKLQAGQWPVAATLDLHGANSSQAAERFDRFLHSCLEHHVRCVCIVHGKGYGSEDGNAVLKDQVTAWLKNMDAVSAFIPAPENMGGSGALVVLLKAPANQ